MTAGIASYRQFIRCLREEREYRARQEGPVISPLRNHTIRRDLGSFAQQGAHELDGDRILGFCDLVWLMYDDLIRLLGQESLIDGWLPIRERRVVSAAMSLMPQLILMSSWIQREVDPVLLRGAPICMGEFVSDSGIELLWDVNLGFQSDESLNVGIAVNPPDVFAQRDRIVHQARRIVGKGIPDWQLRRELRLLELRLQHDLAWIRTQPVPSWETDIPDWTTGIESHDVPADTPAPMDSIPSPSATDVAGAAESATRRHSEERRRPLCPNHRMLLYVIATAEAPISADEALATDVIRGSSLDTPVSVRSAVYRMKQSGISIGKALVTDESDGKVRSGWVVDRRVAEEWGAFDGPWAIAA